jgi:hypothetical protein
LISLHDFALAKGILVFLQKEIKVDLVASPPSPVAVGTEVNFTASSVGFHLPRFEFYTRTNGEQTVTQRDSAKNSWTWFPDKEGKYIAGVRVRDLKQTRETELPFEVIKK